MDLYLIRHGETVDNVAGLYAGVTDSALTNHGVDQIKRLGEHFASNKVVFTHIFASPLSRAFKTAQAIQSAQPSSEAPVEITKVQNLIEQNFGSYEKKTFQARTDAKKTGREAHRERHLNDPGFVDVESKEAMAKRADDFLDQHLLPLLAERASEQKLVVAVVSHGMLLSQLWKRLLLRLPPKSVTIAPEVTVVKGQIILQHLGGWSNTGYLELALSKAEAPKASDDDNANAEAVVAVSTAESVEASLSPTDTVVEQPPRLASGIAQHKLLIVSIDRKDHLIGLKRQRGGIGRSKHDEGQQKLDGFFKRQRTS
ncbi:hypothetical protein CKM354_000395900 [Cercospora kikuchii]|uniref:Phosphoglycerate mutase-like protein n=1 Tax=Cercospora kikuchii TaxID=84275 RepID=A0A9P3CIX8_9PEZI|nr:uncharacterized protein CKM354_000395900 [Cercospora kikuchii]GIZ40630.1 hypothetical protein CKM354_000395900 [Cercospora kikuchii]